MEEHAAALSLQRSRARLRALLLPDPATGRIDADVFPRSVAMRALIAGIPLVVRLATRSRPLRLIADFVGSRR